MASQALQSSAPAPQIHPKARRVDIGRVVAYVLLVFGAFIALAPFLYTISVSLMNLTEANSGAFLPKVPQWGNYAQAWKDASFSLYFWNTVKVTAITLVGQVIFCTMAAYAFAQLE
ncbi:MAG: carbohydrate ABC transporter permease, partial [Anaerolineales bacterium]|nr:carbohydrate ABC transporter permease [Anaerolineales bacterium]